MQLKSPEHEDVGRLRTGVSLWKGPELRKMPVLTVSGPRAAPSLHHAGHKRHPKSHKKWAVFVA